MWPKVIAQLVEMLPHISRLIPMADRFFQSKTAGEKANEAALTALAKDVRADLGQVTSAHDALYRQLQAQDAAIAEIAAETRRTQAAVDGQLVRTAELHKQLAALGIWVKAATGLLLVAIALLLTLLRRA